ncbi:MAG TPA: lytic transglycosylase domain-containing protein [Vicinamibacterales bacterium]|nr:lytic transglycosylase domain-containing protein [Vicinamibacterales bacterium]
MRIHGRRPMRCGLLAALLVVAGGTGRASAELVFLTSGRTMSIARHRIEGNSVLLVLRDGGRITCDRSLIRAFKPDEVPYPVPATAAPAAPPAATRLAVTGSAAGGPWGALITRVAASQGIDPHLVQAVVAVESAGESDALSPKGAMGLMQLMPGTARQYHVDDPYNPRANVEAGVRHLKALLRRYPLRLALAAYNAGEAAVQRFGGVPPYPETQAYVARVMALFGR